MNHRQTTLWRFVATATVVSALVGSFAVRAYAAPNTEINYQGKLTDSDNTAVADGAYKVRFRVYTVASGGTALFDETHSLAVSSGLFSAMLGSAGSSTADVDWSQNALYLGVEVSNDGEMTPRKRISSVPSAHFSLDSAKLQGLVASDFIATSTFSIPSIGSVGSTSATTTFPGYIDVSRLKIGSLSGLLKQVGAVVTTATAGVDYITSAFQNWELTDGYLAPTTTLHILINNATSTITNLSIVTSTSTNATSTYTHISTLLTGALARITDAVFTNATTTNATSTNHYISGQLTLASLPGPLQAISGVVSASSTLSVAYGGTGANTFATNGILYGNTKEALQVTAAGTGGNILMAGGSGVPAWVATTSIPLAGDVGGTLSATVIADNSVDGTDIALGSDATGDLMYYGGADWARLGIGTAGYVLANVGGAPTWVATTTLATISGTLSLANGGTSKALTAAAGGAVYSDADSLEITAAGTAGQILMSGGSGAPSWVSTSTTLANYVPYTGASSALDLGAQALTTTGLSTLGGILVNNATSTITNLSMVNSTSTNATSTYTHISTLLTGALARITDAIFTNATTTNATSTNHYISGQLTLASLAGPLQAISGVVSASSTLSVAYGGTGANTFASNGILYGNTKEALQVTAAGTGGNILMAGGSGVPGWVATTSIPLAGDVGGTLSATVIADNSIDGTDIALGSDATGDLMYYDSTNWARLCIGTAGYVLANVGGAPSWVATTTLATISGTLSLTNGGTGKALTAAAGGAVYSDADSLEITVAGTAGQILMSGGSGAPSWGSTPTTPAHYVSYTAASSALDLGAQTLTTTGLSTLTGGILVNNATSTITNLSMVTSTSTNATSTYTHISTLLTGALARITEAIFTNATKKNATSTNHCISGQLTLASLAGPLQAISGVVSASSTLSVAYGGTGANTFATNGILYGNTKEALQVTAAGTGGNILMAGGSGVPGWVATTSIPLAGDVGGTLSATVIADNSIDGTDIALGSDATGDLMYYDSTNWARLCIGTAGYVLANVGRTPSWVATTTLANISGTLSLASGGTEKALTAVAGGAVYSDADSFEITAAGTAGQILMSGGGGAPSWVSTSTTLANYVPYTGATSAVDLGSQTFTTTGLSTLSGSILVNNATSTITNLVMLTSTSTNATSTYTHISTLLTGALARITDVVFTNATSTNATSTNQYISGQLTLASLTGPLQATGGVVSASSPLSVAYGGTGANTFAPNGILYGSAKEALQVTAAGTGGIILMAGGRGVPAWVATTSIPLAGDVR